MHKMLIPTPAKRTPLSPANAWHVTFFNLHQKLILARNEIRRATKDALAEAEPQADLLDALEALDMILREDQPQIETLARAIHARLLKRDTESNL